MEATSLHNLHVALLHLLDEKIYNTSGINTTSLLFTLDTIFYNKFLQKKERILAN
jgi:hypothetical protein